MTSQLQRFWGFFAPSAEKDTENGAAVKTFVRSNDFNICEALWINQTESKFNIIEDLILLVMISFECNTRHLLVSKTIFDL